MAAFLFFTAIGGELFEITPQIRHFFIALYAGKNHFGARNLGPRISDVFLERFFIPRDAGTLVCIAVTEAFNDARLATIKSVQERSDFVGSVLADAMTGGAFSE